MISALTIEQVVELIQKTPEQIAFDWKIDWSPPVDDQTRGELLKDVAAIANGSALSPGFLVYGVNPRLPDPVCGVTSTYDDARLQQLVKEKIKPAPEFLYYEVSNGPKTVAVIHVAANKRRPFIIAKDIGKVRAGQIPIRRGSSTDGVTLEDLVEMFYGSTSGYFPQVLSKYALDVCRQNANTATLAELRRALEMFQSQLRGF